MKAAKVNGEFTWAIEYEPKENDVIVCGNCGKELKYVKARGRRPFFKHAINSVEGCAYAKGESNDILYRGRTTKNDFVEVKDEIDDADDLEDFTDDVFGGVAEDDVEDIVNENGKDFSSIIMEVQAVLADMFESEWEMPFGKYRGKKFYEIDKEYAIWLYEQKYKNTNVLNYKTKKYGVDKLKIALQQVIWNIKDTLTDIEAR